MDKDLESMLSYCLRLGSPESCLMNFSCLGLVTNTNKVGNTYHMKIWWSSNEKDVWKCLAELPMPDELKLIIILSKFEF